MRPTTRRCDRRRKLAEADPNTLLVQDTSWPGYEDVPQWIVDGYATLFDEAADQAAELGADIDLVVVPGRGRLARPRRRALRPFASGLPHRRGRAGGRRLPSGQPGSRCTDHGADRRDEHGRAELRYAFLSRVAGPASGDWPARWPSTTRPPRTPSPTSAGLGVDSGPCGAASLAALRVLATEPARTRLGLTSDSSVLLLNTEGSDAAG